MTLKNKNIIIVGMTGVGKTTIGKVDILFSKRENKLHFQSPSVVSNQNCAP